MPRRNSTTLSLTKREDTKRIIELILQEKRIEAVNMYRKSARVTLKEAVEAIDREWNHIHRVVTPEEAGTRITNPRTALICAAVFGWCGDESCSWTCPVERPTLLAWADSYGSFQDKELESALDQLEKEGLFFRIHPDAFDEPCYYCSYDEKFIKEIPNYETICINQATDESILLFWQDFRMQLDEEYGETWLKEGLCWGQGSQSGSSPWGPCLGRECACFAKTAVGRECTKGLCLRQGCGQA